MSKWDVMGPTLPPDVPCPKSVGECPSWNAETRECEHFADFPGQGRTPESHYHSAWVATWALIGFVLVLAAAVVVAVVRS